MKKIEVKNNTILLIKYNENDYISLTDIARIKNPHEPKDVIKNWLRLRSTLEFLNLWEKINNENFKANDFIILLNEAGKNSFTISPSALISKYNVIGINCKPTKNGGTFAQKDIAIEFASWISPEIKLYVIKEFQRLKLKESNEIIWEKERIQTKLNYLIQTEAINNNLIPIDLTENQKSLIYSSEADLINVALFGLTAKDWNEINKTKKGNIRDYASIVELSILSNLEFYNAKLIENKVSQNNRLTLLNKEANREKHIFNKNNNLVKLKL